VPCSAVPSRSSWVMEPWPFSGLILGNRLGQLHPSRRTCSVLLAAASCWCLSKDALSGGRWVRHITGAHTAPVLYEYVDLWEKLEGVHLQPLVSDRFIWRWTPDGTYSASSAYRSFFLGMSSLLGAKELWKASASPQVKLFFWLAPHCHIWTADRRKRHGL